VTNGRKRGWLWAKQDNHWSWLPIDPIPVAAINTVGAGDVFAAEYMISRWFKGLSPILARDRALDLAARWVSGQPLIVNPCAADISWAEQAL